jgi:hypothetical protein
LKNDREEEKRTHCRPPFLEGELTDFVIEQYQNIEWLRVNTRYRPMKGAQVCSDFHDFYTIKPFWVGDFGDKI